MQDLAIPLAILVLLGFLCMLAGWYGMFFRVRRDDPGSDEAQYTNYIGASRDYGGNRGMAWQLVRLYLQRYGVDGWFWLFVGGVMVLTIMIITGLFLE